MSTWNALKDSKSMFSPESLCSDIESEVVDTIWHDSYKKGQVVTGYPSEIIHGLIAPSCGSTTTCC